MYRIEIEKIHIKCSRAECLCWEAMSYWEKEMIKYKIKQNAMQYNAIK